MLNIPDLTKDREFIYALKGFKNSDQIFNSDAIEVYIESKW